MTLNGLEGRTGAGRVGDVPSSQPMDRAALSGHTDSAATIPAEAHALTLFRILPNGEGRCYTATTFPLAPYQGCERMVRTARAVGWISESGESYGLLEVLDENGDILADFDIPNAIAFAAIKKKLNINHERTKR